MGKYANEDADKLRQYFENYGLEQIFLNEEFVDEFKKVHKKALGYLVIYSEMEKQNTTSNIKGKISGNRFRQPVRTGRSAERAGI